MKKKELLINAQKSGTIVKVVYKSGSQPNRARQIIPLRIEHDQVFAKCLNSNAEKHFLLNKLELLTDEQYDEFEKWDPNFIGTTDYEEFEIRREKRQQFLHYFYVVLVILAIVVVYFVFRSKS